MHAAVFDLIERGALRALDRVVDDYDDRGDLLQQVRIKWLSARHRFRGEACVSTWAYRAAFNAALNGRRARTTRLRYKRRGAAELYPAYVSPAGDPEAMPNALRHALGQLSHHQRRVIIMHDAWGLTHLKIADRLRITPGTSKAQLHKARRHLRRLLDGGGGRADAGAEPASPRPLWARRVARHPHPAGASPPHAPPDR